MQTGPVTHLRRRRLLLAALVVLAIPAAIPPPLLDGIPFSTVVTTRDGTLLRLALAQDDRYRMFVPLDAMAPSVVEATLLQEDQHFYWHPGVNPVALIKGGIQTYLTGGRRRGGSTITMQVARMRYGITSRNLAGKLWQIIRALHLELHHSKKEILEAYLNLASYGGNIEGVGAASRIYFGSEVRALTLPQALALAVIPQHPARRRPEDTQVLEEARARLFARWREKHPEDASHAAMMELPFEWRPTAELPFDVPHHVQQLLLDHPGERSLVSTVDLSLQRLVERQAAQHVERMAAQGVENVSVLLVDTETMEVKVHLGSADFFSDAIHGQVNGTRARRSPGSALKPFVYALAMEQGLIHPHSLLKDAPTRFGGWNPENFDGQFAGPISAHDALIRSRNIPVISLAEQLAAPGFHGFLETAGIPLSEDARKYGLSLVLGTAEVTLEELVQLYAMLANGGLQRPLRHHVAAPAGETVRLLGPDAAFLTLDILKDAPHPVGGRAPVDVHWKTGTSFAFRDAWAVGVFGRYALGVWVGNFDGRGNPVFVGFSAAAPLFFQIVEAMAVQQQDLGTNHHQRRDGVTVKPVQVCSVSGNLPGKHCAHTHPTWFIPGVSPIKTCDIHREVIIDETTGLQACSGTTSATRREVFEVWPSDLTVLFKVAGVPRRAPPAINPKCEGAPVDVGQAPLITSPQDEVIYSVRATGDGKDDIPLLAVTDGDVREVYWFVGERLVGRAARQEPLMWKASPGKHVVRVVDDHGRSDAREVRVGLVQ